ncbi:formate/nitrite transporter family protein [Mesonia maritima]|uniref:Formate/nitrite transporter FocA (FNT family) n=1 Tax=Mesonia maritima TaxID=1793873 RepID=A0ABU1K926_9FLAO|nr:formate/nitrite transporter family protein [Mesonia maritima]MDR6302105.1 formate/nitrite transporter FocA (FNT family) [Mesonia maritima]
MKQDSTTRQDDIDQELEDANPKNEENSTKSEKESAESTGEVLGKQIKDGQKSHDRNARSTVLCSLTAGLEIGFSYLLVCTVFYFFKDYFKEAALFKLIAFVYPFGFILTILNHSLLFTEQTTLQSLPVLNRKRSVWSLLKTWGLIIFGNLVGGCFIALVFIWLGPKLVLFDEKSIVKIAKHVAHYSTSVILVSGILAGWLMGLLSYMLTSAKSTISYIIIIYMVTGVLGLTGLHHSIVGNIEVFAGLLISPEISIIDYFSFLITALIGNALGGVVFVALIKYGAFVFNVDDNKNVT